MWTWRCCSWSWADLLSSAFLQVLRLLSEETGWSNPFSVASSEFRQSRDCGRRCDQRRCSGRCPSPWYLSSISTTDVNEPARAIHLVKHLEESIGLPQGARWRRSRRGRACALFVSVQVGPHHQRPLRNWRRVEPVVNWKKKHDLETVIICFCVLLVQDKKKVEENILMHDFRNISLLIFCVAGNILALYFPHYYIPPEGHIVNHHS